MKPGAARGSSSPVGEDGRVAVAPGENHKWIVLSNTTIGMLRVTINSSILLIALPDIFHGIEIDPLAAHF